MEKRFLDKVEDNVAVRIWSEKTQQEKDDILMEGYMPELWDFTLISVTQNNLQGLKEIWDQWSDETNQLFYHKYGDLPYLLDVKVDKHLFRALAQYWNPAYSCFTFGKRLMSITGISEQWVTARIKQKGDSKCIHWKSLRDLILTHLNTRKKVCVFALSIYGLVIFPKALGRIDDAISDLFDRLDKRVTPVPVILAETIKSLNACQSTGEGRFIGDFDWIHLLGIWEAVGYTPLLTLNQYRSRQFIPITQGLAQCEFAYKGDNYKKKVAELERSLHQYHSHNSAIELKASLNKIEEMKGKIEELEAALQNFELRDQLVKVQQDMRDQIQESQRSMISQLTQLLTGRIEKGKSTVINSEDDNEDPIYPSGFTPMNVQAQPDTYPRRVPVTIRPQQYQASTSAPKCTEFRVLVQSLMDNKEFEYFKDDKGLEGRYFCASEEGSMENVYKVKGRDFCASEEGSMENVYKVNHPVVIISRPRNNKARTQAVARVII
ncbi:hypothetical protein Gotur_025831 [Gossypium turneri]